MLALARPELVEKPLLRNYLRARGEYLMVAKLTGGAWELPPRTRRIRSSGDDPRLRLGTTSAHAENTPCPGTSQAEWRNYLRARGEYLNGALLLFLELELPPRTRRIPYRREKQKLRLRTTSAHAENTPCPGTSQAEWRNYLRARGEYRTLSLISGHTVELPPRTRRIRRRNRR